MVAADLWRQFPDGVPVLVAKAVVCSITGEHYLSVYIVKIQPLYQSLYKGTKIATMNSVRGKAIAAATCTTEVSTSNHDISVQKKQVL